MRVLQPRLQEYLGQPVVVENKPGAQSIIAAEQAARVAADIAKWTAVAKAANIKND